MKIRFCNWLILLLLGITLITFSGCFPQVKSGNQSVVTENPLVAVTSALYPGEKNQPDPTRDTLITQTSSLSPSATPKLLPTITSTTPPTWTPAPTLSRAEAHALVKDLLENNGGCRLPCWWGMTPGVTDWNTAKNFLETFAIDIGQGEEGYVMKDGTNMYTTNFGIQYERENGGSGFTIGIIDGIIDIIITGWDRSQDNYYLDRLLTDYGQPEEVIIQAQRVTSWGGPPPFSILLSYKQKGFWADYTFDGKLVGEKVIGCPQSTNPNLYLFSPDQEWTKEEMVEATYGSPVPGTPEYPILSLEDVTGMNVETFTNIFKDPNNQICLETPAELWH